MKSCNLGIIGCGNMAQAVIESIFAGGMSEYEKKSGVKLHVCVSDTDETKLAVAAEKFKGLETSVSNAETVKKSEFVLLAVKPQVYAQALNGIDFAGKTVISIMAGVPIAKLQENLGAKSVVRVMPNLNARILQSYNAYCVCGLNEAQEAFVFALLSSFGIAVKTPESRINAVTGITGSGPAFVFMFFKAFAEVAQSYGFSKEEALQAAESVIASSACNLASDPCVDIDKMVESVCSKGGTTIEGVEFLRSKDFVSTAKEAIVRAINRAEELGK